MKINKLNCVSCGAPITVPEDLDYVNCSSCGSFLGIERGEGYIALKIVEKITRAIENSGRETQDVIRESAQKTFGEFQRLQKLQELHTAQAQLVSLRTEIRGLNQENMTRSEKRTLIGLRESEYELMSNIRILNKQTSIFADDDWNSRIKFAQWEIGWLAQQIAILEDNKLTNYSNRRQALARYRDGLSHNLSVWQMAALKSHYPSFAMPDPPLDNRKEVVKLLDMVNEDEQRIRHLPSSPARTAAYAEITQRQQRLMNAFNKLESERLRALLDSPHNPPIENDLESQQSYLSLVQQDLRELAKQPDSLVLREYRKSLLTREKNSQKNIRKLERIEKKRQKEANKQAHQDSLRIAEQIKRHAAIDGASVARAAFGTAVVAAAVASATKEDRAEKVEDPGQHVDLSETSPEKKTTSRLSSDTEANMLQDTEDIVDQVKEPTENLAEESILAGHRVEQATLETMPVLEDEMVIGGQTTIPDSLLPESVSKNAGSENLGAIGAGCFMSFILVIAFFLVGIVITGIVIAIQPEPPASVSAIILIFTAIGILGASRIFFHFSAPASIIRGLFGLPDIKLPHNKHGYGLQSQFLLKLLAAFSVLAVTVLVMLAILMVVSEIPALATLIFMAGCILSLAAAIIIFWRTTMINSPEVT